MKRLLSIWCIALLILNSLSVPVSYAQNFEAAKQAKIDLSKESPKRKAGAIPEENSLEGGIWAESLKVEKDAKTSGERTKHKELEAYVSGLMGKLMGENAKDVRIYTMERPYFNAQMSPNGYSEVWTGLLLRVNSEDELAFVLGHEAGHYLHSHSIVAYQKYKERQAAALGLSIAITAIAAASAANAGTYQQASDIMNAANNVVNIVYLVSIAKLFGFSREQEQAADIYGYDLAKKAGYYPRGGETIWDRIIKETKASDSKKVRESASYNSIFRTHPLEIDRIEALANYNRFDAPTIGVRDENDAKIAREKYRNIIRPYLSEWLKEDIKRRDYGQTLYILDQLAIDGLDLGLINYYRGESYRLKGKPEDLTKSVEFYKTALLSPDAPKVANRQLGEIYQKLEKPDEAILAYSDYIKAAPDAEDAWIVEDLIAQIKAKPKT